MDSRENKYSTLNGCLLGEDSASIAGVAAGEQSGVISVNSVAKLLVSKSSIRAGLNGALICFVANFTQSMLCGFNTEDLTFKVFSDFHKKIGNDKQRIIEEKIHLPGPSKGCFTRL